MATGPDHYRQAENHLDLAAIADTEVSRGTNLLFAVAHALLAQAAAAALGSDAMPPADWREWRSIAGCHDRSARRPDPQMPGQMTIDGT